MTASTGLLDCGHVPTRTASGVGTGYARTADTDSTMCYSCADEAQRAELLDTTTTRFVAYVDGRTWKDGWWGGGYVTTWTGGKLGRIIGVKPGARRYSSLGMPMRWVSYRVQTPDGREWIGRHNAENNQSLVLRLSPRRVA